MDTSLLTDIKRRYNVVGNCDDLNRALDIALQVAPTDLSVLVVGESGVGKEIIPRIIHDNSPRRRENYFAINCGSIPEGTIDSELFGHEKGAFTGAIGESAGYFGIANKGTIFLDEVGELPLATQARLLRVLETGEYIRVGGQKIMKTDVRIIAATNVNLQQAISEGRFREDLYYRLNTVPVQMPPLRQRGEDIILLFKLFALQMAQKYRMPKITLDNHAERMLMDYKWPGNVRQLKNITEQISVLSRERVITAEILKDYIPHSTESTGLTVMRHTDEQRFANQSELLLGMISELNRQVNELRAQVNKMSTQLHEQRDLAGVAGFNTSTDITAYEPQEEYQDAEEVQEVAVLSAESRKLKDDKSPAKIKDIERQQIRESLERNNGNRRAVAEELGMSERTLYRRIEQYGL